MRLKWIYILFLILPGMTLAEDRPLSPERLPSETWEQALEKQMPTMENFSFSPESSLSVARPFSEIAPPQDVTPPDVLPEAPPEVIHPDEPADEPSETPDDEPAAPNAIGGIPEWTGGLSALHQLTQSSRALRSYSNPNPGGYKRRAPWYYPNDGCYAKAAHVSSVAASKGYKKPGKIFAYGNLKISSPYSRTGTGKVYWSYHMVAAYHIGSTVYVIDPLLNSTSAITLSSWLSQISSNPSSVRVAYCDARAYSPSSRCVGGNGNGSYLGHMNGLLKKEYSSLRNLGYNVHSLLGP